MPISVAQLATRTASITFDYNGQNVTVVYSPDKINNEVIAQLDGNSETVAQGLTSIIKSWDIYEDAEQTVMFPIDAERMKELSWPLRLRIRQEVTRDMRPN